MGTRRGAVALVGLVTLALAGAWVAGRHALSRTFPGADVDADGLRLGDPERGRHLADHVLACATCHGDDLGGGAVEGGVLVGRLWAPNLTRGVGGVGADATPADLARAVRLGVARDGRALVFMRSRRWAHLSERDLADLVAWLAVVPPVDRAPPDVPRALGLPLAVALGDGVDASPEAVDASPSTVPWGPTFAYGRYLADVAGCHDCHGADLAGGTVPWTGAAAPDLRRGGSGAEFAAAVRGGRGRDGRALDPAMPWAAFAGLDDTELDALWLYVREEAGAEVADGAP